MKISGIYKIQSAIKPNRVYIGSAVNINHRWNCHLSDLRKNKHHSKKLQNHLNKYGESDLLFSILLGCPKEDLIKNEQYFLDSYKPYFNICQIASSQFGLKRSEETKNKMRQRKHSEEYKLKMIGNKRGCGNKGKTCKPHTKEWKRKARERMLGNKYAHRKHSEEENRAKSIRQKNRYFSEKHRENLRKAWIIRKSKRKIA